MLRGLLKYIEDINTLDNNLQNAAHICAKYGELNCLRLLAANGINLRHKDSLGMDPSHLAAYYNHPHILEFLFETGVPLGEYCAGGKMPFHYACESGALEAVKLMSGYFVDLSMTDLLEGNTGAHFAAKHDRLGCLRLLESLGVPVSLVRNGLERSVAHLCCLHGSVKCLHWFLETFKFDVYAVDSKRVFWGAKWFGLLY